MKSKRKVKSKRNVWQGEKIETNVQGLLAVVEFEKLLLGKLGEADR